VAESNKAILAAVAANAGIAVAKFVAAAVGGSSALLAEGIHSLVDMGNGLLLLVGLRLAKLPADEAHPFGHGKNVYFFSLVVAMIVFGLGGGMSMYEGIKHIATPSHVENITISLVVLAISGAFEGFSFVVAMRAFARYRRDQLHDLPVQLAIRAAKDPTTFSVLLEDGAALAGILVAAAGVILSRVLHEPILDGVASCVIGAMLAFVAVIMAVESHGLIIGERALPWVVEEVRRIAASESSVARVVAIQTMHIGPEQVLVTLRLDFQDDVASGEIAVALARISTRVKESTREVRNVLLDLDSIRMDRPEGES
jgi:cation diffusion facilitator family transporter